MKPEYKLRIFKKPSIGYLKNLYKKSINYLFDHDNLESDSTIEPVVKSGILDRTTRSFKKFGNEMSIFKAPTIVGIKIIYYKSLAFLFESNSPEPQTATITEDNFLYRDLSNPKNSEEQSDKELKIFRYPTIENLKSLYYKSIGKI